MHGSRNSFVLVFLSLLVLPILVIPVSAPTHAQEPLPDVRLLIDVSGSMRESDPQNLREPALELMVQLLPEGSRAGVWTFGQWINMVVPHADVDEQWREKAIAAVSEISNHGLLTNIPDAIELSTFDVERLGHAYRTSVILLTDGKVEVSENPIDNARAARDLLSKVVPELSDWGVTVHTIALSDNADWEFLRAVSQATGGLAERAQTAEELSQVFLQALDIAAPTEQVPMLGGEFLIDESVDEFTVLVFPDEEDTQVELVRPDGASIVLEDAPVGASWYHNERFELITISDPQDGQWQVLAPASITRVNVISHLRLQLDRLPTNIPSGKTPQLGLALADGDAQLSDSELLDLIEVSIRVYRADDQQWEIVLAGTEADAGGELRVDLPMLSEAGRYELVVHVDGRSFAREVSFLTNVIDPQPEIDPTAAVPVQSAGSGFPAWALPTAIGLLLLLAAGAWWIRQGARVADEDDWDDDDPADHYDDDEDYRE